MISSHDGLWLSGAAVLLCGASGRLGTALATELHERGALLTLVGGDANRLNALPVTGARLVADLREPDACVEAVELARQGTGGVDALINAVGVVAFGPLAELSSSAMRELLDTNALVPMLLAQAVLPAMRPGGVIINVSGSDADLGRGVGIAAYAASKAAVRGFHAAFEEEARHAQVRLLDARPPHAEIGQAEHPIEGRTPVLPGGTPPAHVARVICDAVEDGTQDLPSEAFAV